MAIGSAGRDHLAASLPHAAPGRWIRTLTRSPRTGGRLFIDTSSGAIAEPKGLPEALSFLRPGATLVVWLLNRLGRTFDAILQTAGDLKPQ